MTPPGLAPAAAVQSWPRPFVANHWLEARAVAFQRLRQRPAVVQAQGIGHALAPPGGPAKPGAENAQAFVLQMVDQLMAREIRRPAAVADDDARDAHGVGAVAGEAEAPGTGQGAAEDHPGWRLDVPDGLVDERQRIAIDGLRLCEAGRIVDADGACAGLPRQSGREHADRLEERPTTGQGSRAGAATDRKAGLRMDMGSGGKALESPFIIWFAWRLSRARSAPVDQDGAEIVDVGQRRPGDDRVAERLEEAVAVVGVQARARRRCPAPRRARACRARRCAPAISSAPSTPSVSPASACTPAQAVERDGQRQQELDVAAAAAVAAHGDGGLAAGQQHAGRARTAGRARRPGARCRPCALPTSRASPSRRRRGCGRDAGLARHRARPLRARSAASRSCALGCAPAAGRPA